MGPNAGLFLQREAERLHFGYRFVTCEIRWYGIARLQFQRADMLSGHRHPYAGTGILHVSPHPDLHMATAVLLPAQRAADLQLEVQLGKRKAVWGWES